MASALQHGPAPGEARARLVSRVLWTLALAVAVGAATWQWHTAPAHPREGELEIAGVTVPYRLPRDGAAGQPLRVTVAAPPEVTGTLRWRRYPAEQAFEGVSMLRDGAVLVGVLPSQPPGGRLEYSLVLAGPFGLARIPASEPVVMRFEGAVPRWARFPYLLILLASLLLAVRAGLAGLLGRPEVRRLAWIAFVGFTAGGLILGGVVRKHALGAWWAGWPFGHDPAGHAVLLMAVAWAVAAAALGGRRRRVDRFGRTVVVLAAVITVVAALAPHSLRG
jgi:hypothetical protein